jgi:hypothetical protein
LLPANANELAGSLNYIADIRTAPIAPIRTGSIEDGVRNGHLFKPCVFAMGRGFAEAD